MGVEVLIESVQQTMEMDDSRAQVDSTSRKRLRLERGSSSSRESSGNRLTYHRPGKEPILPERESLTFPLVILELPTDFTNIAVLSATILVSLPVGLDLKNPCQTPHIP